MNVIHKQILDFTIDESTDYFGLPERMRQVYWEEVLPRIDAVFSKLSPNEKVYRFEQLEIDLGSLHPEWLEETIKERVDQALARAVQEALSQADDGNRRGKGAAVTAIPRFAEKAELLLHFLQTGVWPWWATYDAPPELQQTVEAALDNEPGRIITFLRRQGSGVVIERLVQQFSVEAVIWLLAANNKEAAMKWKKLREEAKEIWLAIPTRPNKRRPENLDILFKRLAVQSLLHQPEVKEKQRSQLLKAMAQAAGLSEFAMLAQLESRGGSFSNNSLVRHLSDATAGQQTASSFEEAGQAAVEQTHQPQPGTKTPMQESRLEQEVQPGRTPALETSPADQRKMEAALREGIHIGNAGLVLLAPFFRPLFEKAGLFAGGQFVSAIQQERAVCYTQYLVGELAMYQESALLLNKLLCGWPVEQTLGNVFEPTEEEKREAADLLQSAITHWSALGNISPAGFCRTFLLRQGKLVKEEQQFRLLIQRKSFDVLLEKLPWNISLIKSVWMKCPIWVEW